MEMQQITINPIPNQTLSVQLDEELYTLTFKEGIEGIMSVDITRDDVVIVSGARIVAGFPLIPYRYLTTGNFLIITANQEIPFYTNFGVDQFLIYASPQEIAEFSNGS